MKTEKIFLLSLVLISLISIVYAAPQGDNIVISEVHFNAPGSSEGGKEWIELYNPTGSAIDIGIWSLYKESLNVALVTFPSSTSIPAHSYLLIGDDGNLPEGLPAPDFIASVTSLDNGGDGILLKDSSLNNVDAAGWGGVSDVGFFEGTKIGFGTPDGFSIERKQGGSCGNAVDTDNNANDFLFQENPNPQNSANASVEPCNNATIDTTPPASVANLQVQGITNESIAWSWTNPSDADFFENIIYVNAQNIDNISQNNANVTGLQPDTEYTIAVHTKDVNGNVNDNDVSDTQTTLANPAPQCTTDADCNSLDNDYCDGTQIKHDEGVCINSACEVQIALTQECNNGDFCDGVEACQNAQCVAGTAPVTDDSVSCTIDSCDETNDEVDHDPSDSLCDTGEFCDLNIGCTTNVPVCGNEIVETGEDCDDGAQNGVACIPGYNGACTYCSAACENAVAEGNFCGDGNHDADFEGCDDGNNIDGDGCSATCDIEFCGDNVLQQGLGEQCDDGNNLNNDGCSSVCVLEVCGDSITQNSLGEQCDDGNANNFDACRNDCTLPFCGDNIKDSGEQCDGFDLNGKTCEDFGFSNAGALSCSLACSGFDSAACANVCGDGNIEPGEQCDDGNNINDDGCNSVCETEIVDDLMINYLRGKITFDGLNASNETQYTVNVLSGDNAGKFYKGTVDQDVFLKGGNFDTADRLIFSTGEDFRITADSCSDIYEGTFENGGNLDIWMDCRVPATINTVSTIPETLHDLEDTVITAEVTDNLAVSEVMLYYTLNNGTNQSVAMVPGSPYLANLGALANEDILEYYIVATDSYGSKTTSQTFSAAVTTFDFDKDGFNETLDCDDFDNTTYPGAPELVDDIDQNCINDAPFLNLDIEDQTWNEDASLIDSFDLDDHFVDVDNATALSYTFTLTNPIDVSIDEDNNVSFSQPENFNGFEFIVFTASDGTSAADSNNVTMTVNAVNDAPVADNQSLGTDEDTPLNVTLTASDIDLDELNFIIINSPSNGNLAQDNENITYTPNDNFKGQDSFTFKANDGAEDSNIANVTITVNSINDAPRAFNQTLETGEEVPLNITLTSSDIDLDPLIFSIVDSPSNGILNKNQENVTYTPNEDFNGIDSFTFIANDGLVDSNLARISINVIGINDAPELDAIGTLTAEEDSLFTFNVTAADSDLIYGDELTFSANSTGVFDIGASTGEISFTPQNSQVGLYSINITVSDLAGEIDFEVITLNIINENDAPFFKASLPNLDDLVEETDKAFDLTPFIDDIDDDIADLVVSTGSDYTNVAGQVVTFNYPNGILQETVTITVSDAIESISQEINVTIQNTNDAPVLGQVQDVAAIETVPFSIQLAASDEDPTNDTLTYFTNASFGTLSETTGLYAATPEAKDKGAHTVNFTVFDNNNAQDSQLISLIVEPALRIASMQISVDGSIPIDLQENVVVNAKPGSSLMMEVELANQHPETLFDVEANGTLNSVLGLFDSAGLSSLALGESKAVILEFTLPAIIDQEVYELKLQASGEDQFHTTRESGASVFVNVSKTVNELFIESAKFMPNNFSCTRDTALNITLVNTGQQAQNSVGLSIVNEELGLNKTDSVNVPANSKVSKLVSISLPNTPKGTFPVEISAKFFPLKETSAEATLIMANCNPTMNPIPDQTVNERDELVFEITASDSDINDVLQFSSNNSAVTVTAINSTAAQARWTPEGSDVGFNSVEFSVTDGTGKDSKTAIIEVIEVNDPPVIESFSPLNNPRIAEDAGTTQIFSITKSDPDKEPENSALTVRWFVDGALQSQATNSDSFTFTAQGVKGDFEVLVNVSDKDFHVTKEWTIELVDEPVSDLYTFSFTEPIEAATDFVISNEFGTLFFAGPMDLSAVVDLDELVLIELGAVGVDTSKAPQLNGPATITLGELAFEEQPPIFKNEGFAVEGSSLCGGDCSNIDYNQTAGTLTFDVNGFSVYFVPVTNHRPVITSSPITTAFINETYIYNVIVQDSDGDTPIYSLTSFPIGMAISGSGKITWNPPDFATQNVAIEVKDGKGGIAAQSYSLEVKERPKLIISDLDIKVDGNTDRNVENGDRIRHEAAPGSSIEFKLKIENTYDRDKEDLDINDITVEITILDIDDGDDLEEESKEFDLRPEKDKTVEINFEVPLEVEEDTFIVEIHVEGDDENNKAHEVDWELRLEVEKESHEVRIVRASLSPSEITCQKSVTIDAEIANTGSNDEDEVSLSISSPDLGISIFRGNIELAEGTEDTRFKDKFTSLINENLLPGIYPIDVKVNYDSRESDSENLELSVEKCELLTEITEEVREQKPKVIRQQPPKVIAEQQPEQQPIQASFVGTDEYFLLMAILVILLTGTALFIIGAAVIVLRK